MTSKREYKGGPLEYTCDTCGDVWKSGEDNFEFATILMKDEGWKPVKVPGGWEHTCEECTS